CATYGYDWFAYW
nr:immunoglobulin heavy chain junction region [Mus musculus]